MVERHRFMMSLSWSTETTWSYSYTARFPGRCTGGKDGLRSAVGSGRDSWRLTQRRQTLWYVDFYSRGPAARYFRGRPSTRLGNLHAVEVVRQLTGSLVITNKCGDEITSEQRSVTTGCGTRRVFGYALARSDYFRLNHLHVGGGSGGNRGYRRELGVRDCPWPPGLGLTTDWYPQPEFRKRGPDALGVVLGYAGTFSVPFRWDRLKRASLKRLSVPLRYSKTVEYPPADTSDDQRTGVFESQTGQIRTEMRGMWALKRISPPRRLRG
jgi:hypothetical protein